MSDYNGWKNHATWNVALWIGNDEGLYNLALEPFIQNAPSPYATVRDVLRDEGLTETNDGVAFNDSGLDINALDDMIRELAE